MSGLAHRVGEVRSSSPVSYADPTPAQRIRDLLVLADLSQRAAARELEVDERSMRCWCAGKETPPRMALLALEQLVERRRRVTDK